MAVITITETGQTLKTLFPNGTVIRSQVLPILNSEMENAIGERKRWEIDYSSNVSVLGNTVYINPALFVNSGAIIGFTPPGANYYSYLIPEAGGVGVTYECSLNGSGTNTPKILKNYRVAIRVVTATTFTVYIEFFMTYDANGFLESEYQDNHSRLLKDIKNNPEELVADDPDSVYVSEDRSAKVMVYLEKYNGDNGYIVSTTNFKGIFYDAAATITNGVFTLRRNGVVVDTLSDTDDTEVWFDVDSPNGIESVVFWIIEVTNNDSSKDFLQNYDYDLKQIVTGAADSTKFIGPFRSPQNIGGNTYRTIALLKGKNNNPGYSHRLIGIGYEPSFGAVGVSMSLPIDVDRDPCFDGTGFNLEGKLSDYNIQWSGNDLEACIEERMRSTLQMDFTSDKWKNYLLARMGITGTNDIRRYLTQINCTIYREFTDASSNLIRHIYATGTVNKTSPLIYTSTADITSSFPNDGSAAFTFDWRNRYEAAIPNIQSLINGVNVSPFDTQYWGGKAFKVEWDLNFFYDDYVSPFSDKVVFTQNLSVLDYDAAGVMLLTQQGATPESVDICYGSNLCLDVSSPNPANDYKLIATIEAAPGNVATIEEAEDWVGNELPQLTTPSIYDEEEDFGETVADVAKFCVDTTKLILNLPYKITAIAKPDFDGCRRTTEIYDPRKTEINDQRVPEECFN